jgi:hypothetical protein
MRLRSPRKTGDAMQTREVSPKTSCEEAVYTDSAGGFATLPQPGPLIHNTGVAG